MRSPGAWAAFLALAAASLPVCGDDLPLKPDSVRFAVIGDMGTGGRGQYEVARQMERFREKTGFDFVLTLGDNIYGGSSPADMQRKFAQPYKPLLDAGVKFYASLGNHDNPNERFYKPFDMDGRRYYSFRKGNAEFFALDSNYMDPAQLSWLDKALHDSDAIWKICFFHHPLYSDGKFHGPDVDLRAKLEPVLEAGGVRVVLSGHEHVYERIAPHSGIYYFVLGSSGQLRAHGLRSSSEMAASFDSGHSFTLMEIARDRLYFQTVSQTGSTVDSGAIPAAERKGHR